MAAFSKRGPYWRAQVRRLGFTPVYASFDTKTQAEAWARDIESKMDRGSFYSMAEAERTSLEDALDRYYREIILKKSHPGKDLQRIKRWKEHPLAKRHLANLRGADFATYRDARRADGRVENTIRLELQLVSHLFEISRKEWGMEGLLNPLKNIRKPSGAAERDRRLLPGEYEKLYSHLAGSGNCYAGPAFVLAIETSLRQAVLFSLRWRWIDLDKRVITIPPDLRGKGNKGVPSALPLSSNAVTVLRGMPRAISGQVLDCTANAVVCVWKRALKDLGIVGLRWHDLRHEAVSRLFEKGLNPIEVASISGHKGFTMLKRYTQLRAEDLAARLG